MISDDHIPQIPLDHHDSIYSIFKLPCGGKESPKGIQKIVATQVIQVSPQSEMVSMSDVGAWHFNHDRQASRCHDRHDPTSVMANRGHWMLLHSIEVLGTCKLHMCNICKICEFGDQWMIS